MAGKFILLCARVLRPVMDEVMQQRMREAEARRKALTLAEVHAEATKIMDCYNRVSSVLLPKTIAETVL